MGRKRKQNPSRSSEERERERERGRGGPGDLTEIAITRENREFKEGEEPPRTSEEEEEEEDRISHLPVDVLHSILSHLTIQEAGRTPTLSKKWKDLFHTLPTLLINEDSFSFPTYHSQEIDPDPDPDPDPILSKSWKQLFDPDPDPWIVSIIDILNSRLAPIKACKIDADFSDHYTQHFHKIIQSLCKQGIEDLTLFNSDALDCFRLPPFLYSCQTLTCLHLCKCQLAVPARFSGLRCLGSIHLENCFVTDDQFELLVSSCWALESLTVNHWYSVNNLVIHARKLTSLKVITHCPLKISVVEAPQLALVVVCFDWDEKFEKRGEDEVSMLVRLLKGLGHVQSLQFDFSGKYAKQLVKQWVPFPTVLPSAHHLMELKKLTLGLDIANMSLASMLLCLLNSSPSLQELVIRDIHLSDGQWRGYKNNYWGRQTLSEHLKNQLQTVIIYIEDECYEYWMKFIKFLLMNAFALKKLVIHYSWGENQLNAIESFPIEIFRKELFLVQPASPDAIIEFTDRRRMPFH